MLSCKPARLFTIFIFCGLFLSCGSSDKNIQHSLAGNWLVLYPDHHLSGSGERRVYKKYQDSIVNLYGLKLITLAADGSFKETDSLLRPSGNWVFTKDSLLKIREGGKGFNPFNTRLVNFDEGKLRLQQILPLEDEEIEVVWHLLKVEDSSEAAGLFTSEANSWRQKPQAPETDNAIKKRLAGMLDFYGRYFRLVSTEASYFLPGRVPLPLHYYQHAVGISSDVPVVFKNYFYNEADAEKAYAIFTRAVQSLQNDFPVDKNFGLEYGAFIKKIAAKLSQ